jgi:hypothetical protein
LEKLSDFKYLIVTEHVPVAAFIPNHDILSGQGNRLKKQSGINIAAPPFQVRVRKEEELHSIARSGSSGRIVTTLYTLH